MLCGHIHHAEIRDIDGVRYMSCDDWVVSCAALVEDGDGIFHILDWSTPAAEVVPLGRPRSQARSAG